MKKAYIEVNRDQKAGRGARYLSPLEPNFKTLGDVLKRKPSPR